MAASRVLWRVGRGLWALWLLGLAGVALWPAAPDPNLLAYIRAPQGAGVHGLFVYDPARDLSAPLVALAAPHVRLDAYAWSPDGRWLAYSLGGTLAIVGEQVVVRGPRGAEAVYRFGERDTATDLFWHRDSSRLVVTYAANRILTLDPVTGARDEVVAFDLRYIQPQTALLFNPRELLVRGQGVQARRPDYFTISLASGAARAADDLPCMDNAPRDMALSPDGSRLIYGCFDAQVLFVAPVADVDARESFAPLGALGRLGTEGSPRWSPDGSRVLFNHYPMFTQPNEPPYTAYIADLVTGAVERVTPPADVQKLNWLPPGALRRGR